MRHLKDNKYNKILLVAAKLISKKNYNAVSLQKIADKVGLQKSSLFHYFKNKEELLLRILEESVGGVDLNLENIISKNELEPEEKLREAINNHLIMLVENLDNLNIFLNEYTSLSKKNQEIYLKKRKKYEKNIEGIIAEMKTKGYFNGLDTKIISFGLLSMLNGAGKWYKNGGPLTIKEISNIFYKMIAK